LTAYFAMIFLFIIALLARTFPKLQRVRFQRRNRKLLLATFLGLVIPVAAAIAYPSSDLLTRARDFYGRLEPSLPQALKHEVIPRLVELKGVLETRVPQITPRMVYASRVRMWAVALEMIREHPLLGIGVG